MHCFCSLPFYNIYLFIWLHQVLVAALGIFDLVAACVMFPEQELNPGPLPWKHGVLATGPPGKSPHIFTSSPWLLLRDCAVEDGEQVQRDQLGSYWNNPSER